VVDDTILKPVAKSDLLKRRMMSADDKARISKEEMQEYRNYPLVFLSIVIANLAAYTALDLSGRVTAAHG
jgi:hypothetical protein